MKSINEYIVDNNPSMKYLRLYYREKGIFLNSTDRRLIDNLRLPYELKGKSRKHILSCLSSSDLTDGTYLYSSDEDYGLGRVVKLFDDKTLMLVLFNERELPTMCHRDRLVTVHDDTERKLKKID